MIYPVAPGAPDYSSDGATKYISAIYSALLIKKFYPQTVFGKIANTDYEGEIKSFGDSVFMRTRPVIETFRYKKGMILPIQNPESPFVTLKIDQGDGFSFAIDKIDEFQSNIALMNEWGDDASQQMKQVIDRNLLITVAAAGAVAGGKAATTVTGYTALYPGPSMDEYTIAKGALVAGGATAKGSSITGVTAAGTGLGLSDAGVSCDTSGEIVQQILYYGRLLDENNAPDEGRFVVLPSWCMQKLKDIGAQFAQVYASGLDKSPLLSGKVPGIDRFEILMSNNLATTTQAAADATSVVFGTKYAATFATQITENRIIDNPFAWGKLSQGLQVYGYNIIKPAFIGVDFIKNA